MKINPNPAHPNDGRHITSRRKVIGALSAAAIAGVTPKVFAQAEKPKGLRDLAGGQPLIGTALPTRFDQIYSETEKQLLASHFDSITPENCMKWTQINRIDGVYNFAPVDAMMALAKTNRQKVIGHTLVFNRDGNYPNWILRDGNKEADARLVWQRLEAYVEKVMTRYQGQIDSWDVLNEFVEINEHGYRMTHLARVLGEDFPVRLFKLAAEIDPKAKLVYNDYQVESPHRRPAILKFVRSLLDRGCRVDVIGSQCHLELDGNIDGQLEATIDEYAALGVRFALTELDVDVVSRKLYWNPKTRPQAITQNPYQDGAPDEVLEGQARFYRKIFQAVAANRKHVDRVTFWGISDAHSWLNTWPWKRVNHGLIFDREGQPKPAFHAVAETLAGMRK